MNTSIKLKLGLLVFLLALAVVTVVPSFYAGTPDWWKKYMAPEGLRLGLDLQGGMHLVLKVDLQKAEENSLEFAANDLKDTLSEQSISAIRTPSPNADSIIFTLPNANSVEQIQQLVKEDFPDISTTVESSEGSFPRIILSLSDEKKAYIKNHSVEQSLEIIRNRIDQFGVAEPVIIRQGTDEIVIQLPGVKDPKRAMKLLGDTAQLEFKMVAEPAGINLPELIDKIKQSGQWKEGEDRNKLNRALQSHLPEDTSIYFEKNTDPQTKREIVTPILLENKVLMTGDMVKDAQVRIGGSFNEPYVSLDLTGRGGKLFGHITEQNVGRRMAIVLDGNVRSAPVIREKILGGSAQISGSFTHEEAADLAIVLRVGALPAPVNIIQNMTVGASLGQDSINKGLISGVFGTIMVVGFMMIYYRTSGAIANVALFLNIVFLFAGLAILNATLTLPGIAGIVLSIGMAVDSNVLIFERIREELAIGKSIRSSIDGGFDKAFFSILDSQVTTLITAVVLFMFGTGPIKGFAITLSLGILFNLYTALSCSQMMFELINRFRPIKHIKYLNFIEKPNFDYLRIKNISFLVSGITALIGVFALIQIALGHANLGVDFAGGSLFSYKADKPFELAEIRKVFAGSSFEDIDLQEVENESRLIVKVKKTEEVLSGVSDSITRILNDGLPDRNFTLESQSEIGASVSSTLRDKALVAIFLSMCGIVVYLAIRFDLRFGLAGMLATLHDVFCVIGICWLLNIEMNLLLVTALLTLAGYSINDSVVVFDRIRENMHKHMTQPIYDTINMSVNEVVSRTFVTGTTTILVLLSLYFLGGSVIHDFSLVLIIGILIGTYSSVFVASPILTLFPEKKI